MDGSFRTDDLQQAHFYLARLKLAQGNTELAWQAIKKTILILKSYRIPRLTELALTQEATMALKLGNLAAASNWAHAVEADVRTDNHEYILDHEKKTLARIWLAETRLTESRQLLEVISSTTRAAEQNGTLLESLVLLAIVYWQQGEVDKSMMALAEVVKRTGPHGYVRFFVDEGEPMREMLSSCLKQTQWMPLRAYIEKVLAAYGPATAAEKWGSYKSYRRGVYERVYQKLSAICAIAEKNAIYLHIFYKIITNIIDFLILTCIQYIEIR